MTEPSGVFTVDELDIVPNWSVVASNRALTFMHRGDVKRVVLTNTTNDYYLYYSQDYTILNQKSYYEDFGTGINLFINCRFLWDSPSQTLTLPLPSNLARNSNVGSVMITWEESGKEYSTNMGKCYLNDARSAVVIESTIFAPQRVVQIDAAISYHLETPPEPHIYT